MGCLVILEVVFRGEKYLVNQFAVRLSPLGLESVEGMAF